jgi:predicted Zn-dependent protease
VARETVESFRRLTAAEKGELKPYHLATHRVATGESADKLAQRLPYQQLQLDRFRILNGLQADQGLQAGQLVKLIVAD